MKRYNRWSMRIALTLDRDAVGRERNDYVTSLLGAGFRRDEIEVLGPGARPSGPMASGSSAASGSHRPSALTLRR